MGFWHKWWPLIGIFLLLLIGWYLVFGVGLVPAYSRDPMDVGIELDFATP